MDQPRKLAFYELGRGAFLKEIQEKFERAQKVSFEDEVSSTLTVKIKITPPDPDDLRFSTLDWGVQLQHGSKSVAKSQSIELDSMGNIIADGRDPADLLQLDLEIPTIENLNITARKAS